MRLLLFLLFPALELYLLVKVGGIIGALNMVLWVFASAGIGIWAAKAQGQSAMLNVRTELDQGRVPQQSFMDGLLLFFGGVLLILPGLITDAIGLFLLVPPFRRWAAGAIGGYLTNQQARGQTSRVFFFRSVNLGGDRGARARGFQPPHDMFHGVGAPDQCETFDAHAEEPRQATVVESKVIDLHKTGENGLTAGPDADANGNVKG